MFCGRLIYMSIVKSWSDNLSICLSVVYVLCMSVYLPLPFFLPKRLDWLLVWPTNMHFIIKTIKK